MTNLHKQKDFLTSNSKQNKNNLQNTCCDSNYLNALVQKSLTKISNVQLSVSQIQQFLAFQMGYKNVSSDLKEKKQKSILLLNQIEEKYSSNIEQINFSLFQKKMNLKIFQLQKQIEISQEKAEVKQKQMLKQLQKKIVQKGERQQIHRAINLSNLLCIQIQQIKQRQNQMDKQTNAILKIMKLCQQEEQKAKNSIQKIIQQTNFSSLQQKNILLQQQVNSILANLAKIELKLQINQKQNQYSMKKDINSFIKQNFQQFTNQLQLIQKNSTYALTAFRQQLNQIQNHFNKNENLRKKIDQFEALFCLIQKNLQKIEKNKNNLQTKVIIELQQKFKNNLNRLQKNSETINEKILKQIQKGFLLKQKLEQIQNNYNVLKKFEAQTNNKTKKIQSNVVYLQKQIKLFQQNNLQVLRRITEDNNNKISKEQLLKQLNKYIKKQDLMKITEKFQTKIQKYQKEQKIINNALCSQNIVARWLWDGDLKGGNLVNWSKQIINTLPQNFSYLNKQFVICILTSGLYRIQFGFYCKKKPTVQLLVNGKIVISAVNTSSYVIHHSSGKLKDTNESQVTGLTYIDFLMIPQHSRIAITYNSQAKGQGFINISRL